MIDEENSSEIDGFLEGLSEAKSKKHVRITEEQILEKLRNEQESKRKKALRLMGRIKYDEDISDEEKAIRKKTTRSNSGKISYMNPKVRARLAIERNKKIKAGDKYDRNWKMRRSKYIIPLKNKARELASLCEMKYLATIEE